MHNGSFIIKNLKFKRENLLLWYIQVLKPALWFDTLQWKHPTMIPKTGGYFQKQFEVSVCFLDGTGESIKETELGKMAK